MTAEHHRPVLQPAHQFDWLIGSDDAGAAQRVAQETSWALLSRVRGDSDPRVVEQVIGIAETDGIDDIAELWSHASPHSLAGQLWRIYLLRRVVGANPLETTDLYLRGLQVAATIDPVVAGVAEPINPDSLMHLCDTILRGAFRGDLAIALDRASSYCSVVAMGAAALADERDLVDDAHSAELTTRALRYDAFANELRSGARRWRDGNLD